MLRLLRPLGWQHLYLPLMHTSMYPILATVLRNHEPFFISTYREVVNPISFSYFSMARSSKISFLTMSPQIPSLIFSLDPFSTLSSTPRTVALVILPSLILRQVWLIFFATVAAELYHRKNYSWSQTVLCRRLYSLWAAWDCPRVRSYSPSAADRGPAHDGRCDWCSNLKAISPGSIPAPNFSKTPRCAHTG